jgi:hypothetical protein
MEERDATAPPEAKEVAVPAPAMEIETLLPMLESPVKLIASKLVKRNGYSANYEIVLSTTMSAKYVGAVTAGGTPKIYLNASTLLALMSDKKGIQLKYILSQLLEKAARMQHTLSITPVANSIALPYDSKRFVKNPTKVFTIDYARIVMSYMATAIDTVTGDSVDISTHSIANIEEAGRIAVERLARINNLIITTEIAEVKPEVKPEVDPSKIKFGNVFLESGSMESVKLSYDVDSESL